MDGLALLRAADAAGLTVNVDGDRLVIHGPRSADATRFFLCYEIL